MFRSPERENVELWLRKLQTIIIDALNVIHKSPFLKGKLNKSFDDAANSLLKLLQNKLIGNKSIKYVVVFDSGFEQAPLGSRNIQIVIAHKDADSEIKRIAYAFQSKNTLALVSSDTELHNFAKFNSIEPIDSSKFAKDIEESLSIETNKAKSYKYPKSGSKREKPQSASKKEIDEMKRLFGVD